MQIKAKLQYFLEKIISASISDIGAQWLESCAKLKFNIHFARVHKINKGDLHSSGRTISAMKDGSREYD